MVPLLLTLLLAQGRSAGGGAGELEGVWIGGRFETLIVGKDRADWLREDVHSTATLGRAPAGGFSGEYVSGRELRVGLYPMRDAKAKAIWDGRPPYLMPNTRTTDAPYGEVRITIRSSDEGGQPKLIQFEATSKGGRKPEVQTFTRALPVAQLSLAGKYGDGEMTLEIADSLGSGGEIRGSGTYLGKAFSLVGIRALGRAAFRTFGESTTGDTGSGSLVWSPTIDGARNLRDHATDQTDGITVSVRFADGGEGVGVRKRLKRLP